MQKNLKERQKKEECAFKKYSTQTAKALINENAADGDASANIRERKIRYMDAYFTDFDLQGRKAYHELFSTKQVRKSKSQFTDLNLLFTNSIRKEESLYERNRLSTDISREDISKFALNYWPRIDEKALNFQDYRDVEKFFAKPNRKLWSAWLPFHYKDIPKVKLGFSKQSKESNRTSLFHLKCNNNLLVKHKTHRIVKEKEETVASNKCENGFVESKKPNQKKVTVRSTSFSGYIENDRVRYREKKITISHKSGFSLEKFGRGSRINFSRSCNITEKEIISSTSNASDKKLRESESKGEKIHVVDELPGALVEDSLSTSSIDESSFEEPNETGHFKDIYYLKKKYNREIENSHNINEIDNVELQRVLKEEKNILLNFDMNGLIKNGFCPDDSAVKKNDQLEKAEEKMSKTNKVLLETPDKITKKKKVLEVIFPVKSLRTCANEMKTPKAVEHDIEFDEIEMNETMCKSTIEVEITKKTVFKGTELREENRSQSEIEICGKEGVGHSRCLNLKLYKSTIITRKEYADNNRRGPVKMMLNSDEFRKCVLTIIEQYLKENYLNDDNFEVIIVPKNKTALIDKNPMTVLRDVINSRETSSIGLDSDYKIEFPDLSTFNPRDFKGYTTKRGNHSLCKPPRSYNCKTLRKKMFYDRPKLTVKNRPQTVKPNETETLQKNETNNELSKYLSMPVFKLKSLKRVGGKIKGKYHKDPSCSNCCGYTVRHNGELVMDLKQLESNKDEPKNLSRHVSFQQPAAKLYKYLDVRKRKRSHSKCGFLTEFTEFRKIFDEVEDKHNELLHVFNYDPCGLLFKFKTDYLVTTNTKHK